MVFTGKLTPFCCCSAHPYSHAALSSVKTRRDLKDYITMPGCSFNNCLILETADDVYTKKHIFNHSQHNTQQWAKLLPVMQMMPRMQKMFYLITCARHIYPSAQHTRHMSSTDLVSKNLKNFLVYTCILTATFVTALYFILLCGAVTTFVFIYGTLILTCSTGVLTGAHKTGKLQPVIEDNWQALLSTQR